MNVTMFVSYSHLDSRWIGADKEFRFPLILWLASALKTDGITLWYDRSDEGLQPGHEFQQEIEQAIDRSQFALLLVSEAFFSSEFIQKVELPRILARTDRREMAVIPILLEPCEWQRFEFIGSRQMLPGEPTPLIDYTDSERNWAHARSEILSGIRRRVKRRLQTADVIARAQAEIDKGYFDQAITLLEAERALATENPAMLELLDTARRKKRVAEQLAPARAKLEDGDYDGAIRVAQHIQPPDDELVRSFLETAFLARETGQKLDGLSRAAEQAITRARAASASRRWNDAVAAWQEAIVALSSALELAHDDPGIKSKLAEANRALNENQAAAAREPILAARLAAAQTAMAQTNYGEAQQIVQEVLAEDPKYPEAQRLLAEIGRIKAEAERRLATPSQPSPGPITAPAPGGRSKVLLIAVAGLVIVALAVILIYPLLKPSTAGTHDLREALAGNLVEARFQGTGKPYGDAVLATLINRQRGAVELEIPAGTMLHSNDPQVADMVVLSARPVGDPQAGPGSHIRLGNGASEQYLLEAYGTEPEKGAASLDTLFTPGAQATGPVAKLLSAAARLGSRHDGDTAKAIQAAVWSATVAEIDLAGTCDRLGCGQDGLLVAQNLVRDAGLSPVPDATQIVLLPATSTETTSPKPPTATKSPATPSATSSPVPSTAPTATDSPVPSPTPSVTSSPRPTVTTAPTRTATAVPAHTATARRAATPTATRRPAATPRPTPRPLANAPVPQSPEDSAVFNGRDAKVGLSWSPAPALGPNDYYVVRILRKVGQDIWPDYQWVRQPSIEALPDYLYGATADNSFYRWAVAVVTLLSGEASNDPATPAGHAKFLTDYGPERKFQWLPSSGSGGGGEPGAGETNTPRPSANTPRP